MDPERQTREIGVTTETLSLGKCMFGKDQAKRLFDAEGDEMA